MDQDNALGREIGNYRLLAEINSGSFGRVYRAEHKYISNHMVAIKLLHASLGFAKEREQFAQEAQILAMLEHPHILSLLDFGFIERQPYLIARYAAGGSLRDLLQRQALLPPEKVMSVLTQVGQALHYAHQRQVIHRDLKPENILFNAQGDVLLADFGIATMITTASVQHLTIVSGTPSYMAPEQFQGVISKEGDQYALGCIAYELVTGHRPFSAPDFLSLGFKHLSEQPIPPRQYTPLVPAAIEAAILKAMAKQRQDRYATISDFLADFSAPFTQSTVLQTPVQQPPQVSHPLAPAPSLSVPASPALRMALPSQDGISTTAGEKTPIPAQPPSTFDGRNLSMPGGEPVAPSLAHPLTTHELPLSSSSPNRPTIITMSPEMRGAGQPRGIWASISLWRKVGLATLALLVIVGGLTAYLALSVHPAAQHQATASVLSQQATANALATTQVRLTATARAQATVQAQATANAHIIATAQAQGKPQLLWTFATGSLVRSSPAVVNGSVYVGSDDGKFFAISSVTGQQEWTFATRGQINSRPTVVNGVVYIGSADSNLYALDAMTGQEKWAFPTESGISASPVVVDGTVYISSGDGKLYAIDTTTGQQKWFFKAGGPFWGSLIVANGVVYVGSTDHSLYAIDATTGREKWAFKTGGTIAVSPAIANGVVYVGSLNSRIYAIDATTGQQRWIFVTGDAIWSAPTMANGVVYVGSLDHNLYAINVATGQQRWAFPTGDNVWSTPTVVNGVVYVGSMDHNLYAINTIGKQKWAFLTGGAIQFSSPIVVNGVLYIGSNDHKLYAIAIG